jgi:hypothetical protein
METIATIENTLPRPRAEDEQAGNGDRIAISGDAGLGAIPCRRPDVHQREPR